MTNVSRGPDDGQSPKRKPSTGGTVAGGLRVDLDFRLRGTGLTITRAQVAAVIMALAAAVWALLRFH
jgi:hypothetical protein